MRVPDAGPPLRAGEAAGRAPRPLWIAAAATILLALALAAGASLRRRAASPALPDLGKVPAFALTERSGRPLRLADLEGRVWIADFIFTTCTGLCPAMTSRMARLQRELPDEVRFVSFTVDPRTDTPEALRAYASRFHPREGWSFVTGEPKDLFSLSVDGFKLAAFEVPEGEREPGDDGPFLHSGKFVLVDGRGTIRGYYDSEDDQSVRGLAKDARRLLGAP